MRPGKMEGNTEFSSHLCHRQCGTWSGGPEPARPAAASSRCPEGWQWASPKQMRTKRQSGQQEVVKEGKTPHPGDLSDLLALLSMGPGGTEPAGTTGSTFWKKATLRYGAGTQAPSLRSQ